MLVRDSRPPFRLHVSRVCKCYDCVSGKSNSQLEDEQWVGLIHCKLCCMPASAVDRYPDRCQVTTMPYLGQRAWIYDHIEFTAENSGKTTSSTFPYTSRCDVGPVRHRRRLSCNDRIRCATYFHLKHTIATGMFMFCGHKWTAIQLSYESFWSLPFGRTPQNCWSRTIHRSGLES